MRIIEVQNISQAKSELIKGTNCSNCTYTMKSDSEKITEKLNKQGGIDPSTAEELSLAKNGDLVTLPGEFTPESMKKCNHPKINQYVTEHMCCAYWDNPGVYRPYGEQEVGK